VRQLRNCLESMVVMARGDTLTVEDLPRNLSRDGGDAPRDDAAVPAAGTLLEEMKRTAIMRALAQFHGNRTRAAEHLGISVRTLQRKLKEWGLPETAEAGSVPWPDTLRPQSDG
jgi:DNA-binding NtrC family response regulator